MFKWRFTRMFRWFFLVLAVPWIVSCSTASSSSSPPPSNRTSPTADGPPEEAYCPYLPSRTFSSSVTVTGSANYRPRLLTASGLGAEGAATPIRRAEVRVTDSDGDVIQCAETDNTGAFSFQLPRGSSSFTVSVSSRGYNSHVRASVLNQPEKNQFYKISTKVTASTNSTISLTARATGSVLAGAFNIFDQILKANEYLRTEVNGCSANGCTSFSVAKKISAYWTVGFNPGSYYDSGPLSFYLPSYYRLFILGGVNGDVDDSDTDHFDNSVIIHEYGHFLEDVYSVSDSPGGSHDGDSVIDPRLAWSEGWANFLQAAVLNSPWYIDTHGNSSGSTYFLFKVPLEDPNDATAPAAFRQMDVAQSAGEGTFREFAVSRILWDVVDPVDGTEPQSDGSGTFNDDIASSFEEIWTVFTSSSNGFRQSSSLFRNIGLLHEKQSSIGGFSNWVNLRTNEGQKNDRSDYGLILATGGGCGAQNFSITPANIAGDDGSFASSDQFRNNDFYQYSHSGGTLNLVLTYAKTGVGSMPDLDLFVYKKDYTYGDSDSVAAFSQKNPSSSGNQTESISKSLAAGKYMINVQVFTGGSTVGTTASYDLKVGGSRLCP